MDNYLLRISFNDEAGDQVLELSGLDLEQAEHYAGEVRYEVERARAVNAPIAQVKSEGRPELTLDLTRVVGVDLEDADSVE